VAGCAGFSMQTSTGNGTKGVSPGSGNSGSQSSASSDSNSLSSTLSPPAPSAAMFDEVSEEDNKQMAREFKVELRVGEIGRLFEGGELFSKVEEICGTKVWDQCQILNPSERNDLGWRRWSFKRKDQNQVYVYPEMFYGLVESRWAEKALHKLAVQGDDADIYIKMVTDKCGEPFTEDCQVRAQGSSQGTFSLTVKNSGEVIELMSTLREWKEDM